MHKQKIDMADEIYVINVGGYIGSSTRSEIEYAKRVCESQRVTHQISGRNNGMTKETGYNAIKPNRADDPLYREAAV